MKNFLILLVLCHYFLCFVGGGCNKRRQNLTKIAGMEEG